MPGKFKALLQLIHFDRPTGTLLLLWPTLGALWIAAQGTPDMALLGIFASGAFLVRSAGYIISHLADQRSDGNVVPTPEGPLAIGTLSVNEASLFCAALCLGAFVLVLFTNSLTIMLSLVAVLVAATYPFIKRYTNLPQLVPGIAFSFAIPMAFSAQRGDLPPALWLLFLGNLLWMVAYDTQYAKVIRAEDVRSDIEPAAILPGNADNMIIAALQLMSLLAMFMAGLRFELGLYYNTALSIAAALFFYQHHLLVGRACLKAFKFNNWVGLAVFSGIVLQYHFS